MASHGVGSARAQLLDRCIDYLKRTGFSDLSLRELAAGADTSHRMLLYHFGSRDGLFAAVVDHMEGEQRQALDELAGLKGDLREICWTFWKHLADPELAPAERLFFEVYAHALRKSPWTEGFANSVVSAWERPLAELFIRSRDSVNEQFAHTLARLFLATARGLLLDLLITGDRELVDEALEAFLGILD